MKKVIIAEDNEYLRGRLVEAVSSLGIKVCSVENGLKLVKAVKLEKYDLILTDNKMPILDGLDAIIKIREFNKQTPIYLLSFEPIKKIAKLLEERALEYGAKYISKSDDNFYEKIEQIKKTYLK